MVWICRAIAVSEHPYWIRCTPLLHSQQYRCKVPIAKSGGSRCFSLDYLLHVLYCRRLSLLFTPPTFYISFFSYLTVQASTRLACCCMITPFLHGRQRRVWWSLLYTMHTKEELEFCPRLPKFPPLLKILKCWLSFFLQDTLERRDTCYPPVDPPCTWCMQPILHAWGACVALVKPVGLAQQPIVLRISVTFPGRFV